MGEFAFSDGCAELSFGGLTYELGLNAETLSLLRRTAEELGEKAAALHSEEELTDAVLHAVDALLGRGAGRAVLGLKPGSGLFDALDVFRYICVEYAGAWRRRVAGLTGRQGARREYPD